MAHRRPTLSQHTVRLSCMHAAVCALSAAHTVHTCLQCKPAFVGCRFSPIESRCASSTPDTSPYGVDSVFKLGSVNFNPDLYDPAGAHLHCVTRQHANCLPQRYRLNAALLIETVAGRMMLSIYNCSQLRTATYNVYEPATKLVNNPRPYCAELFNPR